MTIKNTSKDHMRWVRLKMVETSNVTERERDDKSLHNTQMPQNSHVEGVGTKVQKLSEKDRKNMVVYFLGGGGG